VIGGMTMSTDYSYLLDEYPEIISQNQLYRIYRISKRKATWLLENGYIPCEDSGKKTRRFKIQITDVIEYLTALENNPEIFITPPGIFSSGYKSKHKVADQIDSDKFMTMLKKKWSGLPDALTVSDVTKLAGYCQSTISDWILKGEVLGVRYYSKYLIPKECLIEYIATKAHYSIHQKSQKHRELIQQYLKLQDKIGNR
jgi:hypothetical protein